MEVLARSVPPAQAPRCRVVGKSAVGNRYRPQEVENGATHPGSAPTAPTGNQISANRNAIPSTEPAQAGDTVDPATAATTATETARPTVVALIATATTTPKPPGSTVANPIFSPRASIAAGRRR